MLIRTNSKDFVAQNEGELRNGLICWRKLPPSKRLHMNSANKQENMRPTVPPTNLDAKMPIKQVST